MSYEADEYRIVPATWRDLPAVRRLERAAFERDAYSWLELLALLTFPSVVNLKAVDAANRLVGYVAGDPRPSQGFAWIVTIAVDAAHRRRGLGRRLLEACEDALPMRLIRLTVRASNAAAIALYRQCGYQEQSVWRGYYRDGRDGVVMEKEKRHGEHGVL
jgi:ribosomal protein S18 acetylase RimI-like enzyme